MAFVQIVTFLLGQEVYGVDICSIHGIVKRKNYKFANVPLHSSILEGVINLRGTVNPVFNLKRLFKLIEENLKFNCESDAPENSEIVLVQHGNSTIGFLVDEVTDIFRINDEEISSVPSTIDNVSDYLIGIGKIEGNLVPILDLLKTIESRIDSIQKES